MADSKKKAWDGSACRFLLGAVLALAGGASSLGQAGPDVGSIYVEPLNPDPPPADRYGRPVIESSRLWRSMCGSAPGLTRDALVEIAASHARLAAGAGGPQPVGSAFNIVFIFAPAVPPEVQQALEQVAQVIEGRFGDLVSITITVEWANLGGGILGSTGSSRSTLSYASVRDSLQDDMDPDDAIQSFLPPGSTIPVRYNEGSSSVTNENEITVTWANIRALGGSTGPTVAGMTFNSSFSWDLDPGDGITGGSHDFQSVAAHEVGHALGFISDVDAPGNSMALLDVFRFRNSDGCCDYDPDTTAEFTTTPRMVDFDAPNDAHTFDIISVEHRLSDGSPYQASHFREQNPSIGNMDPALGAGQSFWPGFYQGSDVAVFDAIGWDDPGVLESLPLPFQDSFDQVLLNPDLWIGVEGAEGSTRGLAEPSPAWSLNLDATWSGGDAVRSTFLDTTSAAEPLLAYFYQQTGDDDPPEAGDDLFVEYLDAGGEWVELNRHFGAGPDMLVFEHVSIALPPGAIHPGFRLRFRVTSDETGSSDDWFVDDVCIGSAEQCPAPAFCPDLDGSGATGIEDLLVLLAAWGQPGPSDYDGSGATGIEDLLVLLAAWGPC